MGIDVTRVINSFNGGINRVPNRELGKDAFLQILATQLSNQDPLNAKDNAEYIAQMAQFAALEQMQNLNKNIETLMRMQSINQASSLIGKNVKVFYNNMLIQIPVESVRVAGSNVSIVSNGEEYSLSDVVEILGESK